MMVTEQDLIFSLRGICPMCGQPLRPGDPVSYRNRHEPFKAVRIRVKGMKEALVSVWHADCLDEFWDSGPTLEILDWSPQGVLSRSNGPWPLDELEY